MVAWFRTGTIALCALFCLALPSYADEEKPAADKPKASKDKDDEYYELMKTFVDTFDQIERSYVKETNRRELLEAAIKGMLTELDQYSSYINPDDLQRFNQEVEQEFGGIGIQVHVDPQSKRLTVMTPLPGTPAYKKGMRAGDVIMEIGGKSTEGFTIDDAVKLLKGKPGGVVKLGVLHAGGKEVEQLEITRELISVKTVLGDHYKEDGTWSFWLDESKKIAYIRLTHFSKRSSDELKEALDDLEEAGMKALILDLRFNPGGLLPQAIEISDMFVESGRIVSTKGRNTAERVVEARKEGTYTGFPMAILVNRYSASASEIVSACLQDHKRAAIIGERTWGKGSVQNVIELEGGTSALKLTTASYHRPSGKNIHRFPGAKESDEWGVMPEKENEVKFSGEELTKYLEYRRERDVLGKETPKSDFLDKQLARASEFIDSALANPKTDGEKSTGEKKPDAEKKDTEKKDAEKKDAEKKPEGGAAAPAMKPMRGFAAWQQYRFIKNFPAAAL